MKKQATAIALAAGCLVSAGLSHSAGLDLSLGDETARLSFLFGSNSDPRRVTSGFSFNHSERSIGIFFNEADDQLAFAKLMARGTNPVANTYYSISAGMQLIGGEISYDDATLGRDDETVGALALGLEAGVALLPGNYNPVSLLFEGFYAPSITSFSDAESFSQIGVSLELEITTPAKAYIGYRRISFDTNDYDDITVDRSAHVGLRVLF